MLKARLHNKLGRSLSSAQLGPTARAELDRSEDALTSSVLGRLSYVDDELAWAILTASQPRPRLSRAWPQQPAGTPSWHFWPRLEPHPDDGGAWVEPDVLLRFDHTVVVVEVKHLDSQHKDGFQWRRQLRATMRDDRFSGLTPVLLAIGGHQPARDKRRVQGIRRVAGLSGVPVYRLGWAGLRTALDGFRYDGSLPRGVRALLDDAAGALDVAGYRRHRPLRGLGPALEKVGALSTGWPDTLLAGSPRSRGLRSFGAAHRSIGGFRGSSRD